MGAKGSKLSRPIIEVIKPRCLRTKNDDIKRPPQPPEGRTTKARKLRLEDWLLASPGNRLELKDYLNGGELYVIKHFSSKVHPSSSKEIRVDSETDVSDSSFSTCMSGKSKKKVSFRLPEETDIRIFYSPIDVDINDDDQQPFF
ncbi:hypothetical protein V6N13_013339 [Hibiscus sabdariffa]|uniref:Uncharacterized protein n=2 Tax=Hibiscus sabdariffa TaxID=183260 RepID=A0ABR2SI01_9ROSI